MLCCTKVVCCSSPFKISLFCMTAVLHGSQSAGRRGGRAAEWTHGRWLPASGCLARTGQEGRVLLQDSTVLPLHVSNSACYVSAVTHLFYTVTVELNRLFWSRRGCVYWLVFHLIQWLFCVLWNNLREELYLHSPSQILFILLALVIVIRKMCKTVFWGKQSFTLHYITLSLVYFSPWLINMYHQDGFVPCRAAPSQAKNRTAKEGTQ